MDLKTAMMERIFSMRDKLRWDTSLQMSWESLQEIMAACDLSRIDHVYVLGCGTSLANAYIGESFIEGIAGQQAEVAHPLAFSLYMPDKLLNERKLVLGITGAGVTTSVEKSLQRARAAGAYTIAVTGAKDSNCARAADAVLMTDALNEGPTVRTVSNIYLQLGLYAFALAYGQAKGTVDAAKRAYWDDQLDRLIASISQVLSLKEQIERLAEKYHARQGEMVLMLGSGPNFGTAWEGSLMSVEMGWIDSAGYDMEEFTHGRFRECDERKPLLFVAPHGPTYEKFLTILDSCNKAHAPAVVLTDQVTDEIRQRAADIVEMPGGIDELLTPLLYVFPLWLFDYHTGILRGVDPASQRYGITARDINR